MQDPTSTTVNGGPPDRVEAPDINPNQFTRLGEGISTEIFQA